MAAALTTRTVPLTLPIPMDLRRERIRVAGDVVLLGALSLLFLIPPLIHQDLWNGDEATYAEAAREMVDSGSYLTPRIGGEVIYWYPPLMYWLICIAGVLWGGFTTVSVCLPSVAAAIGGVLITYRLGTFLWNRTTGRLAALLLLMFNGYVAAGYLCRADMVFMVLELAALAVFVRWYGASETPRGPFPFWRFYLLVLLAVLAKGPQGLIVLGGIVGAFLLWRRDWESVRAVRPWWGVLVVLAGAVPWYLYNQLSTDSDFLFRENLDVFLGKTFQSTGNTRRPWYNYIPIFLARTFPWLLYFPSVLILLRRESKGAGKRLASFFLLAILFLFVFYSLAATKRYYYITLMYPSCALLLAHFWTSELRAALSPRLTWVPPFVLFVGVVGGEIFLFFASGRIGKVDFSSQIGSFRILGAVAVLITLGCAVLARRGKDRAVIGILCGLVVAAHGANSLWLRPAKIESEIRKGDELCRRIRETVPRERELCYYKYNCTFLAFYLQGHHRYLDGPEALDRRIAQGGEFGLFVTEDEVRKDPDRFGRFRRLMEGSLPFDHLHGSRILVLGYPAP